MRFHFPSNLSFLGIVCVLYFYLLLGFSVYSFETMYLDMKFSILLALFCIFVNFYLLPLGNSQLLIFSNSTATLPPGMQ